MKSKLLAIKSTIKHWQEMINWASEQYPFSMVVGSDMYVGTHQIWDSKYCSLCGFWDSECWKGCPLYLLGSACDNVNSTWRGVSRARTWGAWLVYARRLSLLLKVAYWLELFGIFTFMRWCTSIKGR
jgi:hypothetical protein